MAQIKRTFLLIALGFFITLSLVLGGLYGLELTSDDEVAPAANTDIASEEDLGATETAQSEQVQDVLVSFQAEFGKFALELDPIYTIVVHTDGDVEGSTSTQVEVARNSGENDGVAYSYLNDYVKIEAYPTSTNGSRDQFIGSDTVLQAAGAKQERIELDGVEVRKFMIDGVGRTEKLYFERAGITYLIEAWDTSKGFTEDTLQDVVKGFSFL